MAKLEFEIEAKVNSEKMVDACADTVKAVLNLIMAANTTIEAFKAFETSVEKLKEEKMTIEMTSKDLPKKVKWWQFWICIKKILKR